MGSQLDRESIDRIDDLHECRAALKQALAEREEALGRVEYFEAILDSIDDETIQVIDKDDRLVYSNITFELTSGFSRKDFIGRTFHELYPPEELAHVGLEWRKLIEGPVGGTMRLEHRVMDAEGRWHHLENTGWNRLNKPIEGVVARTRDLTEDKHFKQASEEADLALRTIFNSVQEAIFIHDDSGVIRHINDKVLDMFGLSMTDAHFAQTADVYYGPFGEGPSVREAWKEALNGESRTFEWQTRRSDTGAVIDVEVFLRPIRLEGRDYVLAVVRDITEKKIAEAKLKASLAEKEALLRETHHRVKNNFAVVTSLLSMQSRRVKDEGILDMLRETQFRVRCMGFVHQQLHKSESVEELKLAEYLRNLVDNLVHSYGTGLRGIQVRCELDEVTLHVDTALNLGFVTSELVSNAIKHAFPDNRGGKIRCTLREKGDDLVELIVEDDGVGIPEDLDVENLDSLGVGLVTTFVKQLEGSYEVSGVVGTRWTITFSPHRDEERAEQPSTPTKKTA